MDWMRPFFIVWTIIGGITLGVPLLLAIIKIAILLYDTIAELIWKYQPKGEK